MFYIIRNYFRSEIIHFESVLTSVHFCYCTIEKCFAIIIFIDIIIVLHVWICVIIIYMVVNVMFWFYFQ